MEVNFRDAQVDEIVSKLNINKSQVEEIVIGYVDYLKNKLTLGESIDVLGICSIVYDGDKKSRLVEPLGYVAYELADLLNQSNITVKRVLDTWQEVIEKLITTNKPVTIKGLIRLKTNEEKGKVKLRIKKSTTLNNVEVRISTNDFFRRKVETVLNGR